MAAYIEPADCLGLVKLTSLIPLFFDVAATSEALPATIALAEAAPTKWHFSEAALAASGELDSYLRGRYAVPVASLSAELVDAVVIMTLHRGYLRRETVTEDRQKAYDDIIKWLKLVARGEVTLDIPSETQTEARGRIWSNSAESILTRDKLRGI